MIKALLWLAKLVKMVRVLGIFCPSRGLKHLVGVFYISAYLVILNSDEGLLWFH